MRLIDADALTQSFRDVMEPNVGVCIGVIEGMIAAMPTQAPAPRNATEARILRAYQRAYDEAQMKDWIIDPMAYAMNRVWSVYDMEGRKRRREADRCGETGEELRGTEKDLVQQ